MATAVRYTEKAEKKSDPDSLFEQSHSSLYSGVQRDTLFKWKTLADEKLEERAGIPGTWNTTTRRKATQYCSSGRQQ